MAQQAYLQQFGFPKSIIRLISRYILDFNSDGIIAELLKYCENGEITPNVVFYKLFESVHQTIGSEIRQYINSMPLTLFVELISQYDTLSHTTNHAKFHILRKLTLLLTSSTINKLHKYLYMELNLLDSITIQACVTKNKSFLNDFIEVTESQKSFPFRCNDNGSRRYTSGTSGGSNIAMRDIVEYFVAVDDPDSLDLIITYYNKQPEVVDFMRVCRMYMTNKTSEKMMRYRDNWMGKYNLSPLV